MTQAQINSLKDRLTTLKSTNLGNLNKRVGALEKKTHNLDKSIELIKKNLIQLDEFPSIMMAEVDRRINASLNSGDSATIVDYNNAYGRKRRRKTKHRRRKRKNTRKRR